jgi:hypothetical protein
VISRGIRGTPRDEGSSRRRRFVTGTGDPRQLRVAAARATSLFVQLPLPWQSAMLQIHVVLATSCFVSEAVTEL